MLFFAFMPPLAFMYVNAPKLAVLSGIFLVFFQTSILPLPDALRIFSLFGTLVFCGLLIYRLHSRDSVRIEQYNTSVSYITVGSLVILGKLVQSALLMLYVAFPVTNTDLRMAPSFSANTTYYFSEIRDFTTESLQDAVLLMHTKHDSDTRMILRVVGVPGEQVSIRENDLYIDDVLIRKSSSKAFESQEYRLLPGEVFVLGDNEDLHFDSRVFGPVSYDKIIGRYNSYWTNLSR